MTPPDIRHLPAEATATGDRRYNNLIKLGLSFAVIAVVFYFIDFSSFVDTLSRIRIVPLLVALGFIILSQYLSSVRFYYLLRDNGITLPRRDAFRANIYGLVGGMILFNVFGQGVTRSILLDRFRVPQSTVFFLTLLERGTALTVLLVAALAGIALLFNQFPVSLGDGGLMLVRYILAAAFALAAALVFGLSRRQRRLLLWLLRYLYSGAVLRLFAITLLMHGSMLAAYMIVAASVVPDVPLTSSAAASAIVMLVASLPISFAGWGLRELSASFAYAHIGFSPEQGVFVGVAIGVMALVALIVNSAWIGLRDYYEQPRIENRPESRISANAIEHFSYWMIGIGAGFAALFHVLVPTDTGFVNVNLGDPLAIVGGFVMLGTAWRLRAVQPFWRVQGIFAGMVAVTVVLTFGLLHSYLVYGPIHWAIFNRFTGWFVLLGYFASGTLLMTAVGHHAFLTLCRVLGAAAAGLVVWDLCIRLLWRGAHLIIGMVPEQRAGGMSGNPNAFTFQLLLAFVVIVSMREFHRPRNPYAIGLLGVILSGLWIAGSRAGIGALAAAIVMMAIFMYRLVDLRAFAINLACAFVLALLILVFFDLAAYALASIFQVKNIEKNLIYGLALSTTDIQFDRMESLVGGLAMWRSHPIYGAGLGAYIHQHIQQTGLPLVIHNSFIWIAAELGLLGLVAFGFLAFAVARDLFLRLSPDGGQTQAILVGAMTILAVMCLVHDMLFQRLFWLLAGAAVAMPCAVARMKHKHRASS